jgi:hypothetical protein
MLTYKQFITEAESKGGHGHLGHAAEAAIRLGGTKPMIGLLRDVVSRKAEVTRKIDGAISLARKDKTISYKSDAAKWLGSPEEVEALHGPQGSVPKSHIYNVLHPLAQHLHATLTEPGSHQFDVLSKNPEGGFGGNIVTYHPTTGGTENASHLVAFHTEMDPKKGPTPIKPSFARTTTQHPQGKIAHMDVSMHPDELDISPKHKTEALKHLDAAEKEHSHPDYTESHLFENGHVHPLLRKGNPTAKTKPLNYVEMYLNSTLNSSKQSNVEDLKNFVHARYQKDGKDSTAALQHIDRNQEHFNRTFRIHNHLQRAVNTVTKGIGERSEKVKRFPFRMTARMPGGRQSNTNVGEGFYAKNGKTHAKLVMSSIGLPKEDHPAEADNFARNNRLNDKFSRQPV